MRFLPTLTDNPILVREIRRRLRGRAMIFSLIAYIVIMSGISFAIILMTTMGSSDAAQVIGQKIGKGIFDAIALSQAFLVWLAAPSITAGMTTAERERQTFEFLQVTTLSARGYVIGNLLSTVMYVMLVLICALPVMSVAFLYGGVGLDDVLTTFGILLTVSMLLSCFALFLSSVHNKTRSIQAVVTIVCVVTGIAMITQRLIFIGLQSGTGVTYSQATLTVFGWTIPAWAVKVSIVFVACLAMVVASGRKLYTPDNRILNYRQFLVLFLVAQALLLGSVWSILGAGAGVLPGWIVYSGAMLCLAAMLYSTGRPEIGDDVWIIKRRHPWLRPFDEGLLFLLLLMAITAGLGWLWISTATPGPGGPKAMLKLFQIGMLYIGGAALCVFFLGRVVSQYTYTRRTAFWWVVCLAFVLYIGVPLISALNFAPSLGKRTGIALIDHSPLFIPQNMGSLRLNSPVLVAFFGLSAVFVLWWLVARRRHREVNYHYELKA